MAQTLTLELLRSRYRDKILAIADRQGVDNVRVFGSYARGDQTEDSDIDFLFTCRPKTDLMDLGGLHWQLEELLGKKVDIATDGGLHPRLEKNILAEAKPL